MRSLTVYLAVLALAGAVSAAQAGNSIVVDGSTTVGPIAKAFAEHYMGTNPGVNITVSESGSGNGAKSLINGACDVADMSRPMKDSEVEAAKENGVQPVAHTVARDGLAIIVHPGNPVKGLSVEQIRDIYLGKIKNWRELGGPKAKIIVISRDTNSGTYETFEEKVMRKEKMAEGTEYVGSNGAVRQRVQSTAAAIGYVGLGFVDETVKPLEVNGILPSPETVINGEYPIARPLFMYTNGQPDAKSHLGKFVGLYKSEKGREIIDALGFVSIPQ